MPRRTSWLRTSIQWLRLVAPPAWSLAILVVFVLIVESLCAVIASLDGNWEQASRLHVMRDGLVVVTAGAYGIYRVWMSHPLFQKECREFLARTPWDRSHPLPLAPIHLVPQDALILGVLFVLMLFRPAMSPAI